MSAGAPAGQARAGVVAALLLWCAVAAAQPVAVPPPQSTVAPAAPAAQLRAGQGGFVLTLAEGRVLRSADLVGARLNTSQGQTLRLDGVQAVQVAGQTLWLHRMSALDAEGRWHDLCTAHSDGSRWAMVLPGRERTDGTVQLDAEQFALTCSSGAQGKCLRLGYLPWATAQALAADRFNACVRMIRGDYGGSGEGFTENGHRIDIYDDAGLQRPDNVPEQAFEAGWSAEGAVCVHHVRVARNATLAALAQRFPRLQGRTGAACTEAQARALGAVVFNRSDPGGQ